MREKSSRKSSCPNAKHLQAFFFSVLTQHCFTFPVIFGWEYGTALSSTITEPSNLGHELGLLKHPSFSATKANFCEVNGKRDRKNFYLTLFSFPLLCFIVFSPRLNRNFLMNGDRSQGRTPFNWAIVWKYRHHNSRTHNYGCKNARYQEPEVCAVGIFLRYL